MLFRNWACSALLLILGGCEQTRQSGSNSVASTRKYKTTIYFQNGSDTEPQSDLEIFRNDSLVFSGTVAYNNLPDDWHTLTLSSRDTVQHISILRKGSATRLDTVVASSDTLTHIFLTYSYHRLTKEDSMRFKKAAYDAEEEAAMRNHFASPKRFSVLVMSGQISIP